MGEDDVLAAFAVVIISLVNVALLVKRRRHRFWVHPGLSHSRMRYIATDFMKNFILDNEGPYLTLLEEVLNIIAPRIVRKLDTRLYSHP